MVTLTRIGSETLASAGCCGEILNHERFCRALKTSMFAAGEEKALDSKADRILKPIGFRSAQLAGHWPLGS